MDGPPVDQERGNREEKIESEVGCRLTISRGPPNGGSRLIRFVATRLRSLQSRTSTPTTIDEARENGMGARIY